MGSQSFNLTSEKFIPVVGGEPCSLLDIFTCQDIKELALDEYCLIALMRLLFCIGQAAVPLKRAQDWYELSLEKFCAQTVDYMHEHRDCFDLYGIRPFLQISELAEAAKIAEAKAKTKAESKMVQPFSAFVPEIRSGNNVLLRSQNGHLSSAEAALQLIALQLHGLAGKRIKNALVLTPGYRGKSKTGAVSPMLGKNGVLHSFYLGRSAAETVWLNLLSDEEVSRESGGLLSMGRPCWELSITGEACPDAEAMKHTYLGRLVPLVRFCLLRPQNGIICTDGIAHLGLADSVRDFTQTTMLGKKGLTAKPVTMAVKPWRELEALLSFLDKDCAAGWSCPQLKLCYGHAAAAKILAVWCGGLAVAYNSGEQKVSGKSSAMSSRLRLITADPVDQVMEFSGEPGFIRYKALISDLNQQAGRLRVCIFNYFCDLMSKDGTDKKDFKAEKDRGEEEFWSLLSQRQDELLDLCFGPYTSHDLAERQTQLNAEIRSALLTAYSRVCPSSTARTLTAFVKNRPYAEERQNDSVF